MRVVKKWGVKCHFIFIDSVFALMIGVKIGCYFNNSMFLIKKYN